MTQQFPQLRKDPIVDRRVLIAPERAARPTELEEAGHLAHHEVCPFCEGHEAETPHEVFALREKGASADGPGWRVRVVPNRFPAVQRDADSTYGVHEVIVECPRHVASLADLSTEQVRDVFAVYRERLAALQSDPRLAYVQVFKNHGAAAGASVEHSHSQVLATEFVPWEARAELDAVSAHHSNLGRCLFCELLERELAAGKRVIYRGEHMIALAAFAGRFPYETWLVPRRHSARYSDVGDPELAELATVTRTVLGRLALAVGDPAYNLILHTAPVRDDSPFHWHWELLPRTTGIAGYELATGCYINTVPPEEAAVRLKT